MRRRDFIAGLGGTAAWPLVARAQQPAVPVVAIVNLAIAPAGHTPLTLSTMPAGGRRLFAAVERGLTESGYLEGRNVAVEYHFEDKLERMPALIDRAGSRIASLIHNGMWLTQACNCAAWVTFKVRSRPAGTNDHLRKTRMAKRHRAYNHGAMLCGPLCRGSGFSARSSARTSRPATIASVIA
jgi:hypothetical protein